MNQTLQSIASPVSRTAVGARPPRVAVVYSAWHDDIVERARTSMLAEFARLGVPPERVDQFEVPGAFEIPLHARRLAQTRRYEAIIACGFVVNGGIYRHEFVASAVIDGLMRAQLDTGVPILSAVLTPRDFHEHEDHLRFFREHMQKKGAEAAQACIKTVASLRELEAA